MTPEVDVDVLVEKAKDGTLKDGEIRRVAEVLSTTPPPDEVYRLLYVIARSRAQSYERLVPGFLWHREDPTVARLALQTLCAFWGKGEQYLHELRLFVKGVDWDSDDDVKGVAVSAAGELLRKITDCELLNSLIDEATSFDDDVNRRVAIEALARALGDSYEAMASFEPFTKSQWEDRVVKRAEARRAKECG
ncbi:hypothetical protein [Sphaerisporangium sp. TRM90804]|uniref:hypothetical protein n=1 Tax=Sphaerisporangium sp. TRM90804 TaxID=3031113 RepID=UPI0024483690|nr:hypothetical protein [Sphaerisporangium sp. TRM90804]MDH2429167.1 hypothetical protein [Sphaerisporangium sp. TRM90804]